MEGFGSYESRRGKTDGQQRRRSPPALPRGVKSARRGGVGEHYAGHVRHQERDQREDCRCLVQNASTRSPPARMWWPPYVPQSAAIPFGADARGGNFSGRLFLGRTVHRPGELVPRADSHSSALSCARCARFHAFATTSMPKSVPLHDRPDDLGVPSLSVTSDESGRL